MTRVHYEPYLDQGDTKVPTYENFIENTQMKNILNS
jgi:hypothetical protein